jgi:hypothetical protein
VVLLLDRVLEAGLGDTEWSKIFGVCKGFSGKSSTFRCQRQIDGAYRCRNPLGGANVATFATLELQVKTLDFVVLTAVVRASLPS